MNQDNNTQRRLELMRLIREENHNNQMRIRTREEILYGKSDSYGGFDEYGYPLTAAEYSRPDESVHMSSFGLRLVIAVLLFGIYYFCRGQDISIAASPHSRLKRLSMCRKQNSLILSASFLIFYRISQIPDNKLRSCEITETARNLLNRIKPWKYPGPFKLRMP